MANVYSFSRGGSAEDEAAFLRQEAVRSAHTALTNGLDGLRNFPIFLAECFEHEVWKHERQLAGGTKQAPLSFHEFVHQPYPIGLGATYATIRPLIDADVKLLAAWDAAAERPSGGANNPLGLGGRSGKTVERVDPETGEIVTLDNIQGDKGASAPTGTSEQAGLRRLRKSAEAGDDRAQAWLDDVLADKVSVHRACVEMGWRKPTVTIRDDAEHMVEAAVKKAGPLETAMRAWRKMTLEDQEQFLEWAGRNMKSVMGGKWS